MRSGQETESIDVAHLLFDHSLHNQRIERLWRDVFPGAYRRTTLFYGTKKENILSQLNILTDFGVDCTRDMEFLNNCFVYANNAPFTKFFVTIIYIATCFFFGLLCYSRLGYHLPNALIDVGILSFPFFTLFLYLVRTRCELSFGGTYVVRNFTHNINNMTTTSCCSSLAIRL